MDWDRLVAIWRHENDAGNGYSVGRRCDFLHAVQDDNLEFVDDSPTRGMAVYVEKVPPVELAGRFTMVLVMDSWGRNTALTASGPYAVRVTHSTSPDAREQCNKVAEHVAWLRLHNGMSS